MKVGGRTSTGIPGIPSPAPNHRNSAIFMDPENPEKGTVKVHSSESCGNRSAHLGPARCTYRGSEGDAPFGVLGAREGPAPRAQVASELALPPKVAATTPGVHSWRDGHSLCLPPTQTTLLYEPREALCSSSFGTLVLLSTREGGGGIRRV